MADFGSLFQDMTNQIGAYAQKTIPEHVTQAMDDATKFLNKTKSKLQEWALAVEQGKMSVEDVEWLLGSEKDLAEMNALKQKGLTKIKADEFKNQMVNIVVNTISKAVPK